VVDIYTQAAAKKVKKASSILLMTMKGNVNLREAEGRIAIVEQLIGSIPFEDGSTPGFNPDTVAAFMLPPLSNKKAEIRDAASALYLALAAKVGDERSQAYLGGDATLLKQIRTANAKPLGGGGKIKKNPAPTTKPKKSKKPK
jgi:hypothetical protein